MKFGIIKERKDPPDRRVVLSPAACIAVMNMFPEAEIVVESSSNRAFKDAEYEALGIPVSNTIDDCDVLLGVKEVPVDALIPNKKYFFFSHTIKEQPYNRVLLQEILKKNIELYDHEVITAPNGARLVAFGRYAGIVGAYNAFRTYGLKHSVFELPGASTLKDQAALIDVLKTAALPAIKILLSGKGRVGNGAKEMLDAMGLKEVTTADYLTTTYEHAVYCQIDVLDYYSRNDNEEKGIEDFFEYPTAYKSTFMQFARCSDIYIAGHFYGKGAPYLFTRQDARDKDFKIKVVADISCDIDGPVASTIRASSISEPIYGYHPVKETEVDYTDKEAIAVMAVDNLPCELPRDASEGFGDHFAKHVIPAFFNGDKEGILKRSKMTENRELTPAFKYLQNYVDNR